MSKDPVPLKAVHHIEFWVGNAKQAAYFYRTAFGFNQIAYSGLETGNRDKASYVMEQGRVRLVFSTETMEFLHTLKGTEMVSRMLHSMLMMQKHATMLVLREALKVL